MKKITPFVLLFFIPLCAALYHISSGSYRYLMFSDISDLVISMMWLVFDSMIFASFYFIVSRIDS